MMTATWSIWLQRTEARGTSTYDIARAALQRALPGFTIESGITPLEGGNPRDGYLHSVALTATDGQSVVRGEFGGYSSFGPTIDDEAVYLLDGFSLIVDSSLPWQAQYALWQSCAREFALLGFEDRTLGSPVFVDALCAFLRTIGEDAEAGRIAADFSARMRE